MSSSKTWSPHADLVVRHARVHTVDLPIEEARWGRTDFATYDDGYVAVKDKKIIAVGPGDGGDWVGPDTDVIDAKGRVLLPGLVDSHMHAQFSGEGMLNIDLRDVPSAEAMFDLIAQRVAVTPAGQFIQGQYWNELLWKNGVIPTRHDLDKISDAHPMFFMRTCFHVACVNSKALAAAGITRDTPDPAGGTIGRDEAGEPNGILYENAAMGLVQDVIPPLTEEQHLQAVENIGRLLNQNGITSVIDANLSFAQMRAYYQALRRGRLSYRARFMFYLDTATGDVPYHLRRLDEMVAVTGFGNDMLKLNGIKVTLDGIPATGTACMRKPYKHMPETSGFTTITPEEMRAIAVKGATYHWQVGVHTIGDKAADIALAAFDAADKAHGPIAENRNYLIHMPYPHEDQLDIMARLNVSNTTQPSIFHLMGENVILNDEQAAINMAAKLFFEKGVVIGGSTDHPVVPCNPFLGMYAAVSRRDSDGTVWGAEYRITPRQALVMWTKNSAYFSHDDAVQGSLAPGCHADMTLIDRDILSCPVEDIKDTVVEMTILGGRVVYKAG